MKPESLVMAHQLRRREYVPRPCTHRPSHHESRLYPKSTLLTARRQWPKVWMVIGMKSEQGSRRGTCGWITSFLRSKHGCGVKTAGLGRSGVSNLKFQIQARRLSHNPVFNGSPVL